MFLTGPKVVKTVTGEDVSQEDLGGASVHSTKSGVTHFTAQTEEEGLATIRTLLSYIPQNNMEEAPRMECTDPIDRMEDALNEIIPTIRTRHTTCMKSSEPSWTTASSLKCKKTMPATSS